MELLILIAIFYLSSKAKLTDDDYGYTFKNKQ